MSETNLTTNCGKLPEFNLSERLEDMDCYGNSVEEDIKEAVKRVKQIKFLTYEQLEEVDKIFGGKLI